jgi:O-antigen/teichoic acid export membrane protein
VSAETQGDAVWGCQESKSSLVTRNLFLKYIVMGVELLIGVALLPFNVAHLGQAAYGVLALTASIAAYFSMLDMGYGLAQERFVAHYRARQDRESLNQVISTMFYVFVAIGMLAFSIAVFVALNLEHLFNLTAEQVHEGRRVLLVMGAFVALSFPFSVFGGVVNGFVRNSMNGVTAVSTSVAAALANLLVLTVGGGLFELVVAVYSVRAVSYWFYRRNAYKVFPGLRIRLTYFNRIRLREVTGFSIFMLAIDLANKVNYSTDALVVGGFLGAAAVAVWTVAQRLVETTQRLTNQLNGSLFPVVVDSASIGSEGRLQSILVQGTRLSLAMVVPMAGGLALLARPLVMAWVGPQFAGSIPIIYLLAVVVAIRVGNATATTLLKGTGDHRLLAATNVAMSIVNLGLSIALARKYGAVGVALGTLIPVGVVSMFWIFPLACRRVGLPLTKVLVDGVWPAIWPMSVMCVWLLISRNVFGANVALVGAQAIVGAALYSIVFLRLAVCDADRMWYVGNIIKLFRRRPVTAATLCVTEQ